MQLLYNFVEHMLCILPFEDEICRLHGLPATYVGHPLLDAAAVLNVAGTSLQHKNVVGSCAASLVSVASFVDHRIIVKARSHKKN